MLSKKFLRKFIVASVAVGSLTFVPEIYFLPIGSAVVHAEIKEYVGVGESIVSDRETLEIGKEGAKLQAIRNAQKQAGVFIGSHSVMKNHELDTDEVVAFTAGVVKVGNVSYEPVPVEQWIKYRATVTVTLDTDDLNGQINRWLGINAQDRSTITEQTKALNGTLDMIQTRTVELETAVAGATATVDSAKVQEELKQIDRDILYAQKISEGNEFMRKGDRAGAMKLYQEAIALYPKDATIAYEKVGDGYLEAKDYARAIEAYTKVTQMDPNYAVPYHKRGKIYFELKDYRKAAADLEKANELAPHSRQVRDLLFKIYLELDNIDSALEFSDGSSLYDAKKYLRFMIQCTKEIESGQNVADNYIHRGHRYYQFGKIERAIQDFDKAIELDPNDMGAYYSRGLIYYKQQQYEQAIKDFEKFLQLRNPYQGHWGLSVLNSELNWQKWYGKYCLPDCQICLYLGECYEKLGYKSKAIEIYSEPLKKNWKTTDKNQHKKDKQEFEKRIAALQKSN